MIFIKIILVIVLIVVIHDAYTIYMYARQSDTLIAHSQAYKRVNPSATTTILVLGDSTAVGTGSTLPADSIAGQFGAQYPNAQILNEGIVGQRIHELAANFDPKKYAQSVSASTSSQKISLVVIQIGANDITHFTPLVSVSTDLETLLQKVKTISNHIVLLHGGDVGLAPIFPWYVKPIFRSRTVQMCEIYQNISQTEGVSYIDMMFNGADDMFRTDTSVYFAADGFHPSSAGYKVWFEKIIQGMPATLNGL